MIVGSERDAQQFAVGGPDRGGKRNLGGEGFVREKTEGEQDEGEEREGEEAEAKYFL